MSCIANIRYTTRAEARHKAEICGILGFKIDRDGKGFYIAEGMLPAPSALSVHDDIPRAETTPVERSAPVVSRGEKDGPCKQIRDWTRAHPDATRQDAIDQFPSFNRATVAIQFKKAREA